MHVRGHGASMALVVTSVRGCGVAEPAWQIMLILLHPALNADYMCVVHLEAHTACSGVYWYW